MHIENTILQKLMNRKSPKQSRRQMKASIGNLKKQTRPINKLQNSQRKEETKT